MKFKQQFQSNLKTRNSALFATSPRCQAIHRIDKSVLLSQYQRLIVDLPRRHSSLLMQLRLGHAPLNKHLHKIGCSDSPICPACSEGDESVLHVLMLCPAYQQHRLILLHKLGCRFRSLHILLNDDDALKPLFTYINKTGRLRNTYGVLEIPTGS